MAFVVQVIFAGDHGLTQVSVNEQCAVVGAGKALGEAQRDARFALAVGSGS